MTVGSWCSGAERRSHATRGSREPPLAQKEGASQLQGNRARASGPRPSNHAPFRKKWARGGLDMNETNRQRRRCQQRVSPAEHEDRSRSSSRASSTGARVVAAPAPLPCCGKRPREDRRPTAGNQNPIAWRERLCHHYPRKTTCWRRHEITACIVEVDALQCRGVGAVHSASCWRCRTCCWNWRCTRWCAPHYLVIGLRWKAAYRGYDSLRMHRHRSRCRKRSPARPWSRKNDHMPLLTIFADMSFPLAACRRVHSHAHLGGTATGVAGLPEKT